ncbi:hypothetical protein [Brevundimonas vesicularis]|uniref:Uncharacterized protein n=1 Tax=Brevundimonas vesicularis TaxID=41276 RepID=A0A1Z3U7B0_BREVE|nr:hypothetical protein [Brevundimonas vesicularis]ASE39145.1 hypothetical protein CEP68_06310 [Brevundimonas vesicularis]
MIFRIVDDATGAIVLSVDQPDPATAALYLKEGQSLFVGGEQLMIDDTRLHVVDGVVARKDDPDPMSTPLSGEGDELTLVLFTSQGDDRGQDED